MTHDERTVSPPPDMRVCSGCLREWYEQLTFNMDAEGKKNELCAVLVQKRSLMNDHDNAIIVHTVPNRAKSKRGDFMIWREDMPRDLEDDVRIIGYVHTHPVGPSPSFGDIERCPDGYFGIVYHVPTGDAYYYDSHGYLYTDHGS